MHADRTNRAMLTLLGLLTLAGGVGALLASLGTFSSGLKDKPLFDNQVSKYIGAHGSWIWAAAALLAVLLVLFCLRWLQALLFSTDRSGDLHVPGDRSHGSTAIRPGAVTDAISTEIGTYRGVQSAKGRVVGDPTAPELVLSVTATTNTDLTQLRQRIETGALTHARQALANPDLPIQLDLNVGKTATSALG